MRKSLKLPAGGEIGIAALLIAIIALMILPLPTTWIDILLAVNIAISVTLLMVSLYMPNVIALSSFPSLLLFTTLFRLSLNIASTKSILLNANGGHIIESFGMLVVGGNLVVGLVVFVIIATVQFIVIAKGAERVAEVSARFTLDAMPGKQISIDADLRAGLLTPDEARGKRATLATESQLYGSMDGAMKFVKGDAIAGLVITLVNIVAGIAVGIAYHDMSAGEATDRFAILSIGDAMVSQIPSLLLSVAAGVMTTRVSDERETKASSLGTQIGRQLSGNARALAVSGVMILGFAAVPGFPSLMFIILAAILFVSSRHLAKRGSAVQSGIGGMGDAALRAGPSAEIRAIMPRAPQFTCPVGVRVSRDLVERLSTDALSAALDTERAALEEELGLPFPGVMFWASDGLPASTCQLMLFDVPHWKIELPPHKVMMVPPDSIDENVVDAVIRAPLHPGGPDTVWLKAEHVPAGRRFWREEEVLVHASAVLLRQHAARFIGIQETQRILDQAGVEYPGLVAEVHKGLPVQRIADVLRRLLEEQISIRNMRNILESLVVWGPREKDVLLLTEYVRGDLAHFLAHRATRGGRYLSAVLLAPELEQHIRHAIKQTPTGNFLALSPDEIHLLTDRIESLAGQAAGDDIAVVTSMDIRRYVRRMIEERLAWLPVYSYQELNKHVELKSLGHVSAL
ncbi:EscV/YscV/HrcV family type III secretion system export apparatus protein [Burkholderia ubonensis]|uniref:type III secretion system export apparatus subunit SctV n=1 Tax=Burkholderia ubonensis TaxID=101571 RepID=UPI0008FE0F91|nr:type III secretion system export apparatus subunit SctV [Burkholderia ubonensis]OJA31032.1 EscV/YscV/HrcV family type III secretion system export apparatus protein [Burkholderia ubonensis]OJB28183.1 EscV/YscV/HrcV family type III secretion system export apparatus protein [Burkholderia ubonensis]